MQQFIFWGFPICIDRHELKFGVILTSHAVIIVLLVVVVVVVVGAVVVFFGKTIAMVTLVEK